jgi:hypothetical protein
MSKRGALQPRKVTVNRPTQPSSVELSSLIEKPRVRTSLNPHKKLNRVVRPKKSDRLIVIQLPKFDDLERWAKQGLGWSREHRKILAGAVALIIVFSYARAHLPKVGKSKAVPSAGGNVIGATAAKIPDFDVVTPVNNGNTPVTKFADKPGASYQDKVGSVNITVSEQTLPDNFKIDPDGEIAKLAKNAYYNEEIDYGTIKAYVGTSAKGPQTLIMHKGSLLIFITSEAKIEKDAWVKYIGTLQ